MTNKLNPPSITTRLVLSIAVCVLLAGTGLVGVLGAWRNSMPTASNQQEVLPAERGPAQVVRFTVYDVGILPREVRVTAGRVALHIEDMSGSSAGLVVVNQSLQVVTQVVRHPQRWRDKVRVSLVPGRYVVHDASRPMNRATLIVEP